MKEATGVPVCGLCLYVCPFGKKQGEKAKQKGGDPGR